MMGIENLTTIFHQSTDQLAILLTQTDIFHQVAAIVSIYLLAYMIARLLCSNISMLKDDASLSLESTMARLFERIELLFPTVVIILLKLSLAFSPYFIADGWVMKTALVIALLLLFYAFISLLVTNRFAVKLFRWIGMPILFFYLTGMLDNIVTVLNAMKIEVGGLKLTAYGVLRTLVLGSVLFWLGRASNKIGQTIIRQQASLDIKSRELFAKIFEIVLFFIVSVLILKLMGINLTALAVLGGAVGVGLGFGLQAIASNFISGVIIIMDKSVSVGDYIEMEDGKSGLVTQLNLRSTSLETFDGKNIIIPNEKFITSAFTNWTHKNSKQRYRIDFSVAYNTDVRSMVPLIKEAVAQHPQVLSGEERLIEERPDCEIDSFGDNGINMFVEFWIEGIDDGKNRVGGDLYLIILETLQANHIEIPFPQRDVHIKQ
jgi:small-conductance mechanosensitive channel|tara:strand:+ start:4664 stop:5959 length:1296 start_codon:yes stop_codon:yes gene_type:complete